MEKYTLILKHTWVDVEECTEENIEEPYIATYAVSTLEDDIMHSKKDIVVNLCDRMVEFINSEDMEHDTDK